MAGKERPVAVVLGGTAPHAVLIDALKARGYRTVLVDYYENPPAQHHADEHVRESTLHKDIVVRIAREQGADLVIATCVDQANTIAVYVAEELGLPHPYSFAAATVIADKTLMKARLVEHDLPTSRHILVDKGQTPDVSHLRYPLVVKPADTNGSAGVRRVDDADALARFLALALDLSRVGRAIIEEFVTGPELSIDCFIEQGHAKIVLVRRKYAVPAGSGVDQVMQSTGSIAPYVLTAAQLADAEKVLSDLARVFDLDNCPMLVQGFLTPEGLSLIEFAARLSGGTGSATTKLISGFDAIEASIDSFLNIPVTVEMHQPALFSMTNTIYAKPGTFDRVEGVDALVAEGIIDQFLPYKTRGMVVGNDMSTRSRIGAFLVTGRDMPTVRARLAQAIARLEVFDIDNSKIMRKDLFERPDH
jgi:biotin carboxylase